MGIETGDKISDLNASWPLGSDPKSEGDDHLRLLKAVLKNDVVSLSETAGHTLLGALLLNVAGPPLSIIRSDNTGTDAKQWDIFGNLGPNNLILSPRNDDGTTQGVTFTFDRDGGLSEVDSVVRRGDGDARFGLIQDISAVNINNLYRTGFIYWPSNGTPPTGTLPNSGLASAGFHVQLTDTRKFQFIATVQGTMALYARNMSAGSWAAWQEVTLT